MKNDRETVEEKEETAGSQPCKRKRLTEEYPNLHQQRQTHATHSTNERKTEQKNTAQF